ncbi:hypothetical protein V2W45_1340622 [Cenococcum geophilum]
MTIIDLVLTIAMAIIVAIAVRTKNQNSSMLSLSISSLPETGNPATQTHASVSVAAQSPAIATTNILSVPINRHIDARLPQLYQYNPYDIYEFLLP